MLTRDAASYFGSVSRLARLLRVSRVAVYMWSDRPPGLRQLQIERLSGGRLKADPEFKPKASTDWVHQAMSARASFYARRKMRAS